MRQLDDIYSGGLCYLITLCMDRKNPTARCNVTGL